MNTLQDAIEAGTANEAHRELWERLPDDTRRHPRLDEALLAIEGRVIDTTTILLVERIVEDIRHAPPPRFSIRPTFEWGGWDEMMLPRPYLHGDGDHTNRHYWIGVSLSTKGGEGLIDLGVALCIPPRLFPIDDALRRIGRRRG